MTTTRRTRTWVAAISLIATIAIGGCSQAPASTTSDEEFWGHLRIDGDEAEGFGSIESMFGAADLVVVARIERIGPSRVIQGDAAEDRVGYVLAELNVERVLRGNATAATVPLEFLAPGAGIEPGRVESLAEAMPDGPMVVFLRAKRGAGEAGLFRVVNSTGLWTNTSRADLDAPLLTDPPTADEPYRLGQVASLEGLIEVLVRLR